MSDTVDIGTILRLAVMLAGLMAVIYVIALLTPWLSKKVDAWIEKYREHHSGNNADAIDYSVRSIYELPPKKKEPVESPEKKDAQDSDKNS